MLLADHLVAQERSRRGPQWIEDASLFGRETDTESREREVLAVRGDLLVLSRLSVGYRDGSVREFLALAAFDGDPVRVRRAVMFDSDDAEAAMTELDRLHAEMHEDGG